MRRAVGIGISTVLALALATACGDNGAAASADARRAEADAPGTAFDAPAAPVTVTIWGAFEYGCSQTPGVPCESVEVVFVDPGGEVISTVTNADGQASAMVLPGASVTVIAAASFGTSMTTLLDIQPGESIFLGQRRSNPAQSSAVMNATFDPPPDVPGISRIQAVGGCAGGNGTVLDGGFEVGFAHQCVEQPTDLGAVVRKSDGRLLSAVIPDVVPDATRTLVFTSWQPLAAFEVHLSGLPAALASSIAWVAPRQNGWQIPYLFYDVLPSGPDEHHAFYAVPPVGDAIGIQFQFARTFHSYKLPIGTSNLILDASSFALPLPSTATLDIPAREIRWSESGAGAERVTLHLARMRMQKPGGDIRWSVYGPRTPEPVVTYPDLGPAYEALMPAMSDDTTSSIGLIAVPGVPGGYQELRLDVTRLTLSPDAGASRLVDEQHHAYSSPP